MSSFFPKMEEASPELIAHLPWVNIKKDKSQETAWENKWINTVCANESTWNMKPWLKFSSRLGVMLFVDTCDTPLITSESNKFGVSNLGRSSSWVPDSENSSQVFAVWLNDGCINIKVCKEAIGRLPENVCSSFNAFWMCLHVYIQGSYVGV